MDKFVAPACFWPGPRFSPDGEPGSRPKDCRDDGLMLTFATVSEIIFVLNLFKKRLFSHHSVALRSHSNISERSDGFAGIFNLDESSGTNVTDMSKEAKSDTITVNATSAN
ncbi:MAG: hypothetical protein KCHDKBKB_00887 [Elusimicrobia bacterium]|nr:hypothetical protein [Elusimicrobiota bacterium]